MKRCNNCGFQNADGSRFCENCGQPLAAGQADGAGKKAPEYAPAPGKKEPKKGKGGLIALIVIGVVALVAAAVTVGFFLFREKLLATFQNLFPQGQVQELLEDPTKQEDTQEEPGQEDPDQGQQDPAPEAGTGEDTQPEENPQPAGYADVDMNGVDNAYIEVRGILSGQGRDMCLELMKPSSAAVDRNGEILRKDGLTELPLAGGNEGSEGAEVLIKGKLLTDEAGGLYLEVVKMDVLKAAAVPADDPSRIHRYEVIKADVNWQEAYEDCLRRGGYLVRINSEEEFAAVLETIAAADMQSVHFFLGGLRKEDGQEYYWVDENGALMEPVLNPGGTDWAASHWMENEPSFTSEDDIEMYLNLVYYKENWVLNDVPADITKYYAGRIGYIVEYEN